MCNQQHAGASVLHLRRYEAAACPAAVDVNNHHTNVVGQQGICNIVPDSQTAGYKVTCNPDGTGGLYSVCTDAVCGTCGVNTPFENAQCLANPAEFGSASVAFKCGTQSQTLANSARITWYEANECNAGSNDQSGHRTIVVAGKNVCQRVPDSEQSYMVKCEPGATDGILAFCTDAVCGTCDTNTFFADGQCLANPPATGSASTKAVCSVSNVDFVVPAQNDMLAQWYGATECQVSANNTVGPFQTLVLGPIGICHTVPGLAGGANAGYKVDCNQAGTGGVFSVCDTNACGTCSVTTPFTNGECLPNPLTTGSQSVRFTCSPKSVDSTAGVASVAASGVTFLGAAALAGAFVLGN